MNIYLDLNSLLLYQNMPLKHSKIDSIIFNFINLKKMLTKGAKEQFEKSIPLGRYGKNEEMADLALSKTAKKTPSKLCIGWR